jgi:hypothetical protein
VPRLRPARWFVALATLVGLVALAVPAGASVPERVGKLPDTACDAFVDYFQIEFLAAFASAFANVGQNLDPKSKTGGKGFTQADIQNTFHLIFSPKLEQVTDTLATQGPKSIRHLFAQQRDVYTRGVAILRDIGLTPKQITALATVKLSPDTDLTKLLGDVKLTKGQIRNAARRFGQHAGALNLNDTVTPAQQKSFQDAGTGCGVFPGTDVKCADLVSSDLEQRVLGGPATVKNKQGSCTYTGPSDPGGDTPVMVVDVYDGVRTFDRLFEQLKGGQMVDPNTYITQGFTSFSDTKTCGRTLYSKATAATVVVAACASNDAAIPDDDLAAVRDSVVNAIG